MTQRHLGGRILHGDTVGAVVRIVDATVEPNGGGVIGMGDQNLLGEGDGAAESFPQDRHTFNEPCVYAFNEINGCVRSSLSHVASS